MGKVARCVFVFFFNDTATTEIYTLSLHDALPICACNCCRALRSRLPGAASCTSARSEEHTSELQSLTNLVCRLLLEKQKKKKSQNELTKKKIKKKKEKKQKQTK